MSLKAVWFGMVGIGQTDYRTAKGYIPEKAVWFSMVYIGNQTTVPILYLTAYMPLTQNR
jgi:hypothetical protein